MVQYDKPFKTYAELIEQLRDKYGLIINDDSFATQTLATFSYYDLINGYKECFMTEDRFIEGTSIENLHSFHVFDRSLQSIILKQSIYIETILKTKLAYAISKNIGISEDIYLSKSKFVDHKRRKSLSKVLESIESAKTRSIKYNQQPITHYYNTKNHIPPWILFKNISFGNAIDLYSFLKEPSKNEVAHALLPQDIEYEDKVFFSIQALQTIKKYRNVIAHNLKFIACKADNAAPAKTLVSLSNKALISWSDIKKSRVRLNNIYALILQIIIMLDDNYLKASFLVELFNHFESEQGKVISDFYCTAAELPSDFAKRIERYLQFLLETNP